MDSENRPSEKLSSSELLSSASRVLSGILESPCWKLITYYQTLIEEISPSSSTKSFKSVESFPKKSSNTTLQSSEPLKEPPQAVPRSCSKDNNIIVIIRLKSSPSKNRLSLNSKINTFDGSTISSYTFMDTRQLTSSSSQSFAPKALAKLSSCNKTSDQTVGTSLKVTQSEPSSIHEASKNLSESSSSRSMPETLPTASQANQCDSATSRRQSAPSRGRFIRGLVEKNYGLSTEQYQNF